MVRNVCERRIMWGDLDSLGIVFYPRYYEWMDGCGHLFFDALALNQGRLWKERGVLFGLVETSCRYFGPGRYDQRIQIVTSLEGLEEKTLVLRHEILGLPEKSRMVLGFEKRICLDTSKAERLRAIPIPADILVVLERAREETPSEGAHPLGPEPDLST